MEDVVSTLAWLESESCIDLSVMCFQLWNHSRHQVLVMEIGRLPQAEQMQVGV